MKKHALVILHSFPTNSLILKGLYDFLSDFFDVIPIDLPGFTKGSKPMADITIENYAQFVVDEIDKLEIQKYWIAGVSFGFYVANKVKDDRCIGYIAIEPFLGKDYLSIGRIKIFFLKIILSIIALTNSAHKIWNNKLLIRHLLEKSSGSSVTALKMIRDHIDPQALLGTASKILTSKEVQFDHKPYILIINPADVTINAPRTIKAFEKAEKHMIAISSSDHFPEEMTPDYFRKNISPLEVNKILKYMDQLERRSSQ